MLYATILIAVLCTVQQGAAGACEPIPPSLTSPKTGQKAWDKCVEYQGQLIYPCQNNLTRSNQCGHGTKEPLVEDNYASSNEFPHMAFLGYGPLTDIKWLCGGVLISERFILATAHCQSSRDYGPVTHVMLGNIKENGDIDESNVYRIKTITKHSDYKAPIKYNDIALLETEKPVELNQFRVPACLSIEDPKEDIAIDTSYVLASYNPGNSKNGLQKTHLSKFTTEECMKIYPINRKMMRGVDGASQICYGTKTESKEVCQRDSGGPLQVPNKKLSCMYDVIGMASVGNICGFARPVIYTKVSHYLPWIESIVWP